MRVWIVASALVIISATAAGAQVGNRSQQVEGRAESIGTTIDVCINSENITPVGLHSFRASGPSTYIHVTSEGLRISSEGRAPWIEAEVTPTIEERYDNQIEALRAAAASNSRVRLRHNDRYFITNISVAYRQRCS